MLRRILAAVLALSLIASLLGGCSMAEPLEYTCQELTVTVPGTMRDITGETTDFHCDFALSSNTMALFGLREEFAMFEDGAAGVTLEQYAQMVVSANGLNSPVTLEGTIPTFTFTSMIEGTEYTYIAAVYASDSAFWLLQASCKSEDFDTLEAQMLGCLTSVKIA